MHDKIYASWLVERNAIKEKGEEPGNEVDNEVQNGGLFCNGKFFTFPTTCGPLSIKNYMLIFCSKYREHTMKISVVN